MNNKNYSEIQSRSLSSVLKIILSSTAEVMVVVLALSFFGLTFLAYYGLEELFSYLGYNENESNFYSLSTLIVIIVAAIFIISVRNAIDKSNEMILKYLEAKEREMADLHDNNVKHMDTLHTQYQNEINRRETALRNLQKQYDEQVDHFNSIVNEKSQSYPWLATLFSELKYIEDEKISHHLKYKSHPAIKASEEISRIAKEKKALQKLNKMYEYQLNYYESVFPWLEEFKEIDPVTGYDIVNQLNDTDDEYERVKNWLSPEEYLNLASYEKWQLALNRYHIKEKSKWEIGRDFERYVGYRYEQKGYSVKYQGALFGLEDMGRDLIASNGNTNLVIQCKRWSKDKTIYEKHIFQLYGSVVLLNTENPEKNYKGIFITTTQLSDVAKKCAKYLDIQVVENHEIKPYPIIKCNVSKDKEKIYHLPFDQQYDRVNISTNDGDCYVDTVPEAEELGFRHAYRWKGSQEQ